jgi:hypothetical protein
MTKNFAANLKIGASLGSSVGRVFGSVNSKIKTQESELKRLRSAYKDASKGSGEYAGKLDQLQKEITETENRLKRMRAASKMSFKGVGDAITGDLKRLSVATAIATAAIGAAGGAVFSVTKGFVDWGDDIGDAAEALSMSTQALQTWQFAAATVGVGGAKMTASVAKFSKSISDGGKATDETLGKLSVNAKRLRTLGLDQQLEVVAEAFKNYQGADKAALAMRLFGRSGYQLAGILSKGKAGLDEFRKAGEKTGAVLDDNAAKAAGDAASALDMFGITMIGLRNTIAIQFVPTLTRLTQRFTAFVQNNGPQIREWATRFANLIETRVVPALGLMLDKLPGIVSNFASFVTGAATVASRLADVVGGWDNLAIAIIALNFAPTLIALGKMAAAMWVLTGATWAAVAPWALIGGAVVGLGLAIASLVDPGGPLDVLGKLFPETMQKVRNSIGSAVAWVEAKIDALINKLRDLLAAFDGLTGFNTSGTMFGGFGGKASSGVPNYSLPQKPYGSILGAPPAGTGKIPLSIPQPDAPPATKEDLDSYLKQQSNNTYNINVNAPGANGDEIAERVRRSFQRKPLYDSNGALAPG